VCIYIITITREDGGDDPNRGGRGFPGKFRKVKSCRSFGNGKGNDRVAGGEEVGSMRGDIGLGQRECFILASPEEGNIKGGLMSTLVKNEMERGGTKREVESDPTSNT